MKSTVIPPKIKRLLKFYIEVIFVIKFKDYVYDENNVSRLDSRYHNITYQVDWKGRKTLIYL